MPLHVHADAILLVGDRQYRLRDALVQVTEERDPIMGFPSPVGFVPRPTRIDITGTLVDQWEWPKNPSPLPTGTQKKTETPRPTSWDYLMEEDGL